MTIEPPKGLKQALLRAYLGFDEEWYLGARVVVILDSSNGFACFVQLFHCDRKPGPLNFTNTVDTVDTADTVDTVDTVD